MIYITAAPRTHSGTFGSSLLWGGQKGYYYDADTHLYLLGAGTTGRWYDPATGKFLSEDPTRHAGGDNNLQRYVSNNPVNQVDPNGNGVLAYLWNVVDPDPNTFWGELTSHKVPSPSARPGQITGLPGNQTSMGQLKVAMANSQGVVLVATRSASGLGSTRDAVGGFGDGFVPFYSVLRHHLGKDFQVDENGAVYAGGEFVGTLAQVVATAGTRGIAPDKVVKWAHGAAKVIQIGERGSQMLVTGARAAKIGSRVVGAVFVGAGAIGVASGSVRGYQSWRSGSDLKAAFQEGTAPLNAFQLYQGGRALFRAGVRLAAFRPIPPLRMV